MWTTCLLFFQSVLLVGYGYAHGCVSHFSPQAQSRLHGALLIAALAMMTVAGFLWPSPITPGPWWKPEGGEIALWHILHLLLISVGMPVVLLAATGPLMQHWFARVYRGESPYRLYALSNVGSLLGLWSYPVILEPTLRLHTQAWLWSAAFVVYAAAAMGCARLAANSAPAADRKKEDSEHGLDSPPAKSEQLVWFSLAGLGSLMLLATTNFITADLAPIPLLWVLPLTVYLISFILCFDHPRWYRRELFHLFLMAATVATIMIYRGVPLGLRTYIGAFLVALFASCVFCHGELYRRRPAAKHLTSFYLMIALGGVAGSAFVNLLAPLLFKGYWEMQLGMAACLITMAVVAIRDPTSWVQRRNFFLPAAFLLWTALTTAFWLSSKSDSLGQFFSDWRFCALGVAAVACTILALRPGEHSKDRFGVAVPAMTRWCLGAAVAGAGFLLVWAGTAQYRYSSWAHRNFYGVLYVVERTLADARFSNYVFMHGNTYHGIQLIAPELRRFPTGYYNRTSGVGLLLLNYPRRAETAAASRGLRVGVVGLGAGTLAAYGLPGDVFRFYEIDPEVIRVASGNDGYFSFLRDSRARVETIDGDGRISLEREFARGQPQGYDIFVVDAFNGDVVPVHLLTKEAFEIYLKHLRDQTSVIAIHVSNRSVDLASVIAAEAEYFQLHTAFINAPGFSNASVPDGIISPNQWILLSRSPDVLSLPAIVQASMPLHLRHGLHFWTDDRSNLLQILR